MTTASLRLGIHQPNYAPWLGYFAKMAAVDAFVFLNASQMPIGRSYVSRVQVRNREGVEWMTVPVKRDEGQPICSVQFADKGWPRKHLAKLRANYARCPFYRDVTEILRPVYEEPGDFLAPFNIRLIQAIASYLGLTPCFHLESDLPEGGASTQRLIDIVRCLGGSTYVSGTGGTKYQDPHAFGACGIELEVASYSPIPYQHIHGDFVPGLSVLDALFHLGPDTRRLLNYPAHLQGPSGDPPILAVRHEESLVQNLTRCPDSPSN